MKGNCVNYKCYMARKCSLFDKKVYNKIKDSSLHQHMFVRRKWCNRMDFKKNIDERRAFDE